MATTTKRIAYNAQITLSFDYENEHIPIETSHIVYLYIDSSYEANVMPSIYLSILAEDELYLKISKYKSSGTFTLTIKKFQLNNHSSTGKVILKDSFNYITSVNTSDFMQDLNAASPNQGRDQYRKIVIGLISKTMINNLRKSFNGVYNNVNESTLVSLALEGTNPVIERLTTNKVYPSIIIPPLSSRYRLLKYIFEKDPFYTTDFIMFMDFKRTYLLSKNGKEVSAGDGYPSSVIISIREITNKEAFYEGMTVGDDHYYLDIAPTDFKVLKNEALDKVINKVTVINENNQVTKMDIDYDEEIDGLNSQEQFIRSNNAELIKNTLESDSDRIRVMKSYIDGSVFTPNKVYSISNYKGNKDLNGLYILESKQEMFKPMVNDFQMAVVLVLKKVGKLNQSTLGKDGKVSYKKSTNKAVTQTGKKSTTAGLIKQANVRKNDKNT